jgi:hypothetical protein
MISHQHKFIFIHIPKCAGTSFEFAFGHMDGHEGRGGQDHRSVRMIERPFPSFSSFTNKDNIIESLRRIKRHSNRKTLPNPNSAITVNKSEYDSYLKFTIVRNPWARAYSWYKNVMRDEIHQKNHNITGEITFTDFLKKYIGQDMLRSQIYWLKDFKGNINMDYIGRFETLHDDFKVIAKKLKIKELTLPHKIKSASDDNYQDAYDTESKNMIAEYYCEEIKLFNYSF